MVRISVLNASQSVPHRRHVCVQLCTCTLCHLLTAGVINGIDTTGTFHHDVGKPLRMNYVLEPAEHVRQRPSRQDRLRYSRQELVALKTGDSKQSFPNNVWLTLKSLNLCKSKKTKRGCTAGKHRKRQICIVLGHRRPEITNQHSCEPREPNSGKALTYPP